MSKPWPPESSEDFHLPQSQPRMYAYVRQAMPGGHGSSSFVETKLYGQRGFPTLEVFADNTSIIPGAGGGAKPTLLDKVGSRAPGYSPNGFVLIRLIRV